jgi:hypothetical protein
MIHNTTKQHARESRSSRSATTIGLLLAVVTLCGCTKFSLPDSLPLFEKKPEPEVPERVVAVWTHSIMNKAGQPSTRGFGGRVTFFNGDNEASILVDGQLTVYGFDDESEDPENPVPEKKFIFPRATLASLQSESNLGPSYSVWLPWGDLNGPQRQVSLICRFDDANGKVILSQSASVTLPGKNDPTKLTVSQSPPTTLHAPAFPVQPASHESDMTASSGVDGPADVQNRPRMHTTTIPMTPSFANRLGISAENRASQTDREIQVPVSAPVNEERPSPVHSPVLLPDTPASDPGTPPPARSELGRSPVRNPAATRPSYDPVRRKPFRGEWLRHLPPTPRTSWGRDQADWSEAAEQP